MSTQQHRARTSMDDPLAQPLPRPPADDIVARIDAQLHQAAMVARFGTGAAPPVHFRQWTIERRLGRGGMGAVYLAFDEALERHVALKLAPAPRTGDLAAQTARVREEARSIAAIKHPNVVQIIQVYLDEDTPIIEMEYVDGPTLRAWQVDGARTWRAAVAAYASAGDGVAAIHRAGLIHRDIKPENLLMAPDGVVRIVDLGLAWPTASRRDRRGEPVNRGEALAGTLGYIAPEVFAGAEPDARSDQFSLCVALYEALYGVRPFCGDTPAALARAMVTGTLTRPRAAPRLPAWLDDAITRGMRCEPRERHEDMDALVRALRTGLARRPTWLRRIGLTVSVLSLILVGARLGLTAPDPCAAADTSTPLAPAALTALRARIGPDNAPALRGLEVLTRLLDTRARAWAGERGQLCRAPRRQDDPAQLLAQWRCIDRRQAQLLRILDGVQADERELPARIFTATTALEQLPPCRAEQPAAAPPPGRESWLGERLDAALLRESAGHYHEAERLARDVIAGAGDSPHLADALYRLGHILGAQDRSDEAVRILERAETVAFETHRDALACQVLAYRVKVLAGDELRVRDSERDRDRAESCIARSTAISPALRADMLEAQGRLATAAGQHDRAVAHHEEALVRRRMHLGEHHMDVSKSLHNLGNALGDRGQPVAALQHLEAALALRKQLVGDEHPLIADILHDLGHLHAELDAPDLARAAYEQAAAILQSHGDTRAPVLADLQMSLADLDLDDGQLDAAAERLRHARDLQAIDHDLAPSHPQRALLLHLEGRLHELRGDFAAALPVLTEATRLLRAHDPRSEDVLQSAINEIGTRYALHDHAGIVAIVRDAGHVLYNHLTLRPAPARGLLAWYIGDSLLNQRAPAAASYLALALAAYRDQGKPSAVLQLQQDLSLALRLRPNHR